MHASDAPGTGAVFELTNPELTLAGQKRLPLQSLRVRLERQMRSDGMVDRLTLRSYAREPVGFDVELELDADFLPMLEVRGLASPATRTVRRRATPNGLRFSAVGVDGRERSTTVTCPGAAPADGRRLRAVVDLSA